MKICISRSSVPGLLTATQLEQLRGWLFLLSKLDLSGSCHPTCISDVYVMHSMRNEISFIHKQMEVFSFNAIPNQIHIDEVFFRTKAKEINADVGGLILTVALDHFQHVSGLNTNRFVTTVTGYGRKMAADFVKLLSTAIAASDKPIYSKLGWSVQGIMGHVQVANPEGIVVISAVNGVLSLGPSVTTEEPLAKNLVDVISKVREHVLCARHNATAHHRMFTTAFAKEWARSKRLFLDETSFNCTLPNDDSVTITDTGFTYEYVYGNTSAVVTWDADAKTVFIPPDLLDVLNGAGWPEQQVAKNLTLAVEKYVENQCTVSVSGICNDTLRALGITPFRLPKHYREWRNSFTRDTMSFLYYLKTRI